MDEPVTGTGQLNDQPAGSPAHPATAVADPRKPVPAATGICERRSIEFVPLSERHGKVWHLFPVWFTGGAQLATVATGVIGISLGADLLWSAIAIIVGCAFGTFFMAFHSTQGPQLGLPQMIQSRPQFGYMGELLVWLVALISYVGYNVFNQVLAGQAVSNLAHVHPDVSYVFFTVFALLIAVAGYDWIHRAQRWLSYPLVIGLLLVTIGAIATVHLLAYAAGFAAEVPFTSTGWYTGPVAHALHGMDLTVFAGLPVSAGAYLLACRSLDTAEEARRVEIADAQLIG
jgi:purine-cytosine permease-like protein